MISPLNQSHTLPAYDVLIIGGGPAGSTAGAWLGRQHTRVLLCEKEQFPRFHIGESLLPNGNHILKEIGVWKKVKSSGFIEKYGAIFTIPDKSKTVRNVFSEGMVPHLDQTFQVERSRFDKILLDHAEESGCEVRQRHHIRRVTRQPNGWLVETENLDSGETHIISTRWIIDASGRSCVMGRELKIRKETIPYPGRFAVFNHFHNVKRNAGKEGGDIIIIRLKDAWFWMIPISKSITSVGIVAQKGSRSLTKSSLETFFWDKIRESSFLSDAMTGTSTKDPFRSESDYCFSYSHFGSDQVLLAGDAASFIDPVFSSGVYLALESGLLSAKTIAQALECHKNTVSKKIYNRYTRTMKHRILTMRKLIENFYDNKDFEVFMEPQPKLKIPEAINSILAGCTLPPWRVRWRYWLFQWICRIHTKRPLFRSINWKSISK